MARNDGTNYIVLQFQRRDFFRGFIKGDGFEAEPGLYLS